MRSISLPALSSAVCLSVLLACGVGCHRATEAKAKSPPPAKVEMVPHETELATVTLTEDAERRLGIETAPVEMRSVQQHRVFGGEVIVPSGKSIVIAAPVAGVVHGIGQSHFPEPGANVKAGDLVLSLTPILSPERDVPTPAEQVQMAGARATLVAAQVTAQGEVQRARTDVAATKISLERAQRLLADRAGSQRAVDDAQALAQVAQTTLAAAEERYAQLTKLLATLEGKNKDEPPSELTLRAPVDGTIRSISVSPGQPVVAGAVLFEVLDTATLWIRVPVFVDLLQSIPLQATGRVVGLDGRISDPHSGDDADPCVAKPVDAPPTADPSTSSADLYFEVSNAAGRFRPGQRVGLELPMSNEVEAAVVPAASILYDLYGGTWVYTVVAPHRFQRQRVSVLWFDGNSAVLERGLASGTPVVAAGAAELFGTEFGSGK